MKAYPRIDLVLARPAIRTELEEYKRLFGLGALRQGLGDRDGQLAAGLEANAVAIRIAAAVQAEPGNQSLPERQLVRYIANVAHHEMLGDMAARDEIVLSELVVQFPAGRPPTRRNGLRQTLIDELRRQPEMNDEAIERRAFKLGVWTDDHADDRSSRRKRVARLRRDAAN